MVLVLGDVGQMQEVGKGTHHRDHRFARQSVEDGLQLGTGGGVGIAVETDRSLADLLDHREDVIALLFAHGVAQQAPKQADVVAEGEVLVLCVSHVVLSLQLGFSTQCLLRSASRSRRFFFAGVSGVRVFVQPA